MFLINHNITQGNRLPLLSNKDFTTQQACKISQDIMQNKGHSILCSIRVITYHENEIAQILVLSRSPDDGLRSPCRKHH